MRIRGDELLFKVDLDKLKQIIAGHSNVFFLTPIVYVILRVFARISDDIAIQIQLNHTNNSIVDSKKSNREEFPSMKSIGNLLENCANHRALTV